MLQSVSLLANHVEVRLDRHSWRLRRSSDRRDVDGEVPPAVASIPCSHLVGDLLNVGAGFGLVARRAGNRIEHGKMLPKLGRLETFVYRKRLAQASIFSNAREPLLGRHIASKDDSGPRLLLLSGD